MQGVYVVAFQVVVGIDVDEEVALRMTVGVSLVPAATFATVGGVAFVGVAMYATDDGGIELLIVMDKIPCAIGGAVVGNDNLVGHIEPLRQYAVETS